MFLKIEHSRVVVGRELNGGLADLLLGRWKLSATIDEEDSLIGVQKKLTRESQACKTGSDDHDVVMIYSLHMTSSYAPARMHSLALQL
jgi:uncharacterized protein YihD (DUF1040 family)